MSFWDYVLFMLVVVLLVAGLVVLFMIIGDVMTDPAVSGWAKAAWLLALLVLPVVGSVVYLVVRGRGVADRRAGTVSTSAAELQASAAGAARAEQLARADAMLASGAITGNEHAALRARDRH
jgi:hypothetical protein